MALPQSLTRVTAELPFALRQDIEGYIRTLDAAQRDIYADAEVKTDEVPSEDFLFFAGIWRLWTQIDGQRWIVRNSLQIATEFGARGISAGGFSYSVGSDDVVGIRQLHDRYHDWLQRHEFEFLVQIHTPRALLEALRAQANAG